jgi:endoglucanase
MKHTKIAFYLAAIFIFDFTDAIGQADSSQVKIRLNQIGFYPSAEKKAIIPGADTGAFYLKDISNRKVFSGRLTFATKPGFSGKKTAIANFSDFKKIGTYYIFIPAIGNSYRFNIKPSVHDYAATATIKAFYFQRASINLDKAYAGKWQRAAGHPDDKIQIHPSAADIKRPAGFIISSPGGWYDAGDYNKYIVNSGISTATLLSLYEDFPAHMQKVKLNIPESNNNLPDILDEVLWNLRWMLTMQDPGDGGVYHKLTNAEFDKMIMPDKAINALLYKKALQLR